MALAHEQVVGPPALGGNGGGSAGRWRRWATLAAALLLLDASLTFQNVWPTPAVRWNGELSIELAVYAIALAAASLWFGPPSRAALRWLCAGWFVLIVGRYAEVTAPALYGRDINLYWDLRYVPDVATLLARAAPPWLVLLAAAAAALILILVYVVLGWALGRLGGAVADPRERRVVAGLAAAAAALFIGQRVGAGVPGNPAFAVPVTETYARQARLVAKAVARSTIIPPSPSMSSDLARVQGADVYLFFVESYGAVSYDRPEFAARLAPARADLEAAARETGRDVASAYVESPTFGGSSWLAHLTLMSGVEVRDHDTNALLMTQKRDTLVTTFGRHGYRTVALMPGLWQQWPEGAFYRFDDIYGNERLAYSGPPFSWFAIPDQAAIAQLDAIEVSRPSRAPLFMFFPTISTHAPFIPVPPYQPDWRRLLTDDPFDAAAVDRAYEQEADWMDLGPGYVDAMAYAYATFGGYLRMRADHDLVMILIGDHQPPAAVAGEDAPWDVPVHIITSRRPVLDRLTAHGFRVGLAPARPTLGPMQALLPVLLDAFGDSE